MADALGGIGRRPSPVHPAPSPAARGAVPDRTGFAAALASAQAAGPAARVTLSAHASARLSARGIAPSERMLERVSQAADMLAAKQARESLVVVGGVGFVVNVKNRVVVTAMPMAGQGPQVFTNIDSAVWLDPSST